MSTSSCAYHKLYSERSELRGPRGPRDEHAAGFAAFPSTSAPNSEKVRKKCSDFHINYVPGTTSSLEAHTVSSREAVAMAQREGEAGDGDAPDADGLVPVPKNEPRSPQVRATSTRHRASRGVPRSVVPVSSITRISQSLVASTTERAGPLTSTTPARLARRPRWCPVSSPRAHPRAPRPPRSRRPPRARRVSLRTTPEASAW